MKKCDECFGVRREDISQSIFSCYNIVVKAVEHSDAGSYNGAAAAAVADETTR